MSYTTFRNIAFGFVWSIIFMIASVTLSTFAVVLYN